MNAAWHDAHPMPPRATAAQRLKWHVAHAKHCGCRPMPSGLLEAAKAKASKTKKKVRAKGRLATKTPRKARPSR